MRPLPIPMDESAEVSTLVALNPTPTPILIVEGEHFLGGRQNRSVNTTVLVPAMTMLEIPVTCLEAGRWGEARSYERAKTFTPPRVRSVNQRAVHESVLESGSHAGNQSGVWSTVEDILSELGTPSSTASVADADHVYLRDKRRMDATEELASLGPLPGQCGVVVTHGRQVKAVELFGSRDLLVPHWSALVRSHLLTAATQASYRPSASAALSVLRRLGLRRARMSPGIGLGHELRVKGKTTTGHALALEDSLVHCGAFTGVR